MEIGVRRLSVGSSLTQTAYGAFFNAATRLQDTGTLDIEGPYLSPEMANGTFLASPR
ncbi:MAG: hypothetical protein ACYCPT_12445 [Acidimicrobiales bacterium]